MNTAMSRHAQKATTPLHKQQLQPVKQLNLLESDREEEEENIFSHGDLQNSLKKPVKTVKKPQNVLPLVSDDEEEEVGGGLYDDYSMHDDMNGVGEAEEEEDDHLQNLVKSSKAASPAAATTQRKKPTVGKGKPVSESKPKPSGVTQKKRKATTSASNAPPSDEAQEQETASKKKVDTANTYREMMDYIEQHTNISDANRHYIARSLANILFRKFLDDNAQSNYRVSREEF